MAKVKYVKCPRCDLNYIDSRQDLCDICKAELGLVDIPLVEDELDDENVILCPICKSTVISADEDMCLACKNAQEIEKDPTEDLDNDDKWKEYLDEDVEAEEQIEIPLEELQDEEFNSVYDDEEEVDDFEEEVVDDDDEFDFDYDDDDEEEDDEDDEEDDEDED